MDLDLSTAFAVFDRQDSGCTSYGIEHAGRRLFVKTGHSERARSSLTRAIHLHDAVRHPAIVAPLEVVERPDRVALVYPWHDGIVLNQATVGGSDRSGLRRFLGLDLSERSTAIETIFGAHLAVAAAGFVSVDLYDGCFLYDFDTSTMRLIDLDEYRPGPFTLEEDRLPGSTRYMAPEELVRGATIDERTTVFQLGRTAAQLTGEQALSADQRGVVECATSPDPAARFGSVAELWSAWRSALGG
jgi:serine/threonine-protein kinase